MRSCKVPDLNWWMLEYTKHKTLGYTNHKIPEYTNHKIREYTNKKIREYTNHKICFLNQRFLIPWPPQWTLSCWIPQVQGQGFIGEFQSNDSGLELIWELILFFFWQIVSFHNQPWPGGAWHPVVHASQEEAETNIKLGDGSEYQQMWLQGPTLIFLFLF